MNITNIPVIQKTPVTGLGAQELLVQAGFSSPITVTNGALLASIGHYTPGSSFNLANTVFVLHDFTPEPGGCLMTSVWGSQNGPVTSEDVATINAAAGSPMPKGTWDVLVIIFDLDGPPVLPISISDHITNYRAGVIAVNAITIN
jgi:hypothetical protein